MMDGDGILNEEDDDDDDDGGLTDCERKLRGRHLPLFVVCCLPVCQ